MSPSALPSLLFLLFPSVLIYGALSDATRMTIPNRLILVLGVGFLVLVPFAAMTIEDFALHLVAGAVVLAFGFAFFAFGWVGGGDAKLAAAIALWLGWDHMLDFVAISAAFGGVLTLAILSFRRTVLPAFALRQAWLFRLHDPGMGVPYGVALAAAGLVLYPQTAWIQMAVG